MSYESGESLVLTRLQAMSQFDADNSSRGNWLILSSGVSTAEQYVILRPGRCEHRWISNGGTWQHTYRVVIELWQRYAQDGTSLVSLETLGSAVRTYMAAYRKLFDPTGSTQDWDIVESQEVLQIPAGAPDWLMLPLIGEWNEEETITFAE